MSKYFLTFVCYFSLSFVFSQLSEENKTQLRKEIHKKVNDLRISLKLPPLSLSDTLKAAAKLQSDYMATSNAIGHTQIKKVYKDPKDRVIFSKGTDFEIVGENVLMIGLPKGKISKSDISKLATSMFEMWKKSPGHYANMIHKDYTLQDFAFTENKALTNIYVAEVFGKRGIVIKGQSTLNAFGLKPAIKNCDAEFKDFMNLVSNMGNNLQISDNKVYFSYHDLSILKKIFSKSGDGIAVDVLLKNQFPCGKENNLDFSPYYDGVMLKPVYQKELFAQNQAESSYRLITEVGVIPENLQNKDLSLSIILIKDGKQCKYLTPFCVPSDMYPLIPYSPTLTDTLKVKFIDKGIVESQELVYDFSTNVKVPINLPEIKKSNFTISSVKIRSYSSVEGDSLKNVGLHNSRAESIKNDLIKRLKLSSSAFKIDAKENWDKMAFQFELFGLDSINKLSMEQKRDVVNSKAFLLDWDSLLFTQRKATATIFYVADYSNSVDTIYLPLLNLHTAVLKNNPKLINKSLKHLYFRVYESNKIILEDEIFEYLIQKPEFVENTAAILSKVYLEDIYKSTEYLKTWVNRKDELSVNAINNLLYLYALLGTHFLDNWDVSNERLSNVVHPEKMLKLLNDKISDELMFNLHLTFIRYYGQINDSKKINESFHYIIDFIKKKNLSASELKDLALFCNYWSMYEMSVEFLLPKFKENKLDLEGVFVLAQSIIHTDKTEEEINAVILKSAEYDKKKWCDWVKSDFQLKRNEVLKSKFCEICK